MYNICPYILIKVYNMLQGYDNYTLHFRSDENPYCYQIIRSALDHKEGNEFSVVLFSIICLMLGQTLTS